MTSRDRHTQDSGPPTPRPPAPSLWEDWYLRASPAQRQQALDLAATQGLVLTHQLPAPENGAAPRRPLLPTLLQGPAPELEPFRVPPTEPADADLDADQRHAAALAAHVPDLALIQGYPGTGKSRVVAEALLQAARKGERALFVAPSGAALDRALERLGTPDGVFPVRCLAADEPADALPACVRRLTVADRVRHFQEHTLAEARHAARAAREAAEARAADEECWARLEQLSRQRQRLGHDAQAHQEAVAGLAEAVERELTAPTPVGSLSALQARWAECLRARDEALARLDARLAEVRAEADKLREGHRALEAERQLLMPLAEAKQGRRWWTATFWRATFQGDTLARLEQQQKHCQEAEEALARLSAEAEALAAERARAAGECQAERGRLTEGERDRRQAELDTRAAALSAEQARLDEAWHACRAQLSAEVPAPPAPTPEAVLAARHEWARLRAADAARAEAAHAWVEGLEQALPTLPARLAACANVVAVTTAALPADPLFGDKAKDVAPFDLLVLEEAHRVTESEFLTLSRRTRRWVLVGEPTAEAPAAPAPPGWKPAPGKAARTAALRPGFFQRLWRHLHADPARLSGGWGACDGRLVCRLRPVPAGQEGYVESESVADRPEVELRIVAPPRQSPQLAEVTFPGSTPFPEAKQYIYTELEELAVQTAGRRLRWAESPECVELVLADQPGPDAVPVALDPGVRELVAPVDGTLPPNGVAWHTCALQFDRAEGWDRDRAERWVEGRLGLRDAGRTALLEVAHRSQPALARFLSDLLFAGACRPPQGRPAEPTAVDFVAVPDLAHGAGGRRSEERYARTAGGTATAAPARAWLRAAQGGAGLELDLADARRPEVLPPEVRAALPAQGVVNYLEARAVVQALEELLADPAFCEAAVQWQRVQGAACERVGGVCGAEVAPGCRAGHCPAVAVMALYPAQVELLRVLLRSVPASPVTVEVGPPAAFHQRECLVALVSLTRSHTHRAVPFADSPQALALALTRPAGRLVLFGDPGTLARRSQWAGALDHLDEPTARRERDLVGQLVNYLQGHGPHPKAFRLQESSSA